jgi:hypothetical protein
MKNTGTLIPPRFLRRIALAICLSAFLCAVASNSSVKMKTLNGSTTAASHMLVATQMGGPGDIGQWGPVEQLDTVPVHISLLPDGRLLYWGRDKAGDNWDIGGTCQTYTWNPSTKVKETLISKPPANLFCSGHSFLSDGRLLVAGGHVRDNSNPSKEGIGEKAVNVFNYRTNTWTPVSPGMTNGRWYPSTVMLPNGEVAIFSGYINGVAARNDIPDLYTLGGTIRAFTASSPIPVYPYLHVGPGGKVFVAGPGPDPSKYFDRAANGGNGSFTNSYSFMPDHVNGSAVTYNSNPSQVLMVGGIQVIPNMISKDAKIIDLTAGTPWQIISPMVFARKFHTAVVLPDGKVLVAAGTQCPGSNDIGCAAGPARNPELWNPANGTWTTMAQNPSGTPRAYHSVALLLPDARVLVGGGGLPAAGGETVPPATPGGPNVQCFDGQHASITEACRIFGHKDVEIFSPPYLFTSTGALAGRPHITTAPTSITYGQVFTVGKNSGSNNVISSVVLIRLPSVTHGVNFDQRRVVLDFTSPTSTSLSVTGPINSRVCPPGPYMLFLVNSAGAPSFASIVTVN